ncbi:MAG: hypothetical protein H6569_05385 [Lewinellaceae bacterium]|nr:hypothetical protein [Lewinellaceae bacterium]
MPDLSGPQVLYYTVQLQQGEAEWRAPEAQDFFERHVEIDHLTDMLDEIFVWLDEMAQVSGARTEFFRDESAALALPPEQPERRRLGRRLNVAYQDVNNLRLYLIRLNKNVVILLNGGEKTTRNALDCPNIRPYFVAAQKIAKALDKAMNDGDIQYNHAQTDIEFDQDLEIPVL